MKKDFKKYLPWIILSVLVLGLSTWYLLSRRITQEQRDLYEAKIAEAQSHIEARQYSMGMKKFYNAASMIPSQVEAYEGILSILITKNRMEDAQEVIEKSAKAVSNYDKSKLYKILGDQYYKMGEYRKAYDLYDAGSFLGTSNMGLELALGETYLNMGDVDNARKQFGKADYEGENLERANLLLSYIYAIDNAQKAKSTLNSVSEIEKMQAYYEEFRGVLESLDEDEKFNATKLSRVYLNAGYPYLAILTLEPRKEDISEYLEGMYFLGRAYFEYGEYEKAIEVLDGALTLGGMEDEILRIKARAYFLTNDLDNAINSYDSAIGHSGSDISSGLVKEYVEFLLDNKQILKASDLIKSLLIPFDQEPYLNLLAVVVNYELEENSKVEFYLNKLEELQETKEFTKSQEKELLQWRILTLLEEDDKEWKESKVMVSEYMDRLFELDRFNPYYRLFLAKIQIKEGEEELVVQSLEQAIEYDLESVVTDEALKMLSSLR